jgi:glyoxylase-like metal-dependent hydrolase (beta-lactamase superfamily II)
LTAKRFFCIQKNIFGGEPMKPDYRIDIVDCGYILPGIAASYLIRGADQCIIIETGTNDSAEVIMKNVEMRGYSSEDVSHIIITHVHLDHAGGAGRLMELCPSAVLLCHPRAARHMIDPSRLTESAMMVYGRERFLELYGEILPVQEKRCRVMEDGERLEFGDRTLTFLHTRGHANHHFCIYDSISEGIFTGDSFGLAYPSLQRGGLFIYPASTATDFDPTESRESIRRILATGARRAYLTHFGELANLKGAADMLFRFLDQFEGIIARGEGLSGEELHAFCRKEMRELIYGEAKRVGIALNDYERSILATDLTINADGLSYLVEKRQKRMRERPQ